MSWMRQVLHVARKDFMFGRWYFLAYTAGIAGVVALGYRDDYDGTRMLLRLGTGIAALGFICLVVQNDSATRVDAFWATRPLSPTAVLAAKIVALFVGMTIPVVIGQAILLQRFGYTGPALIGMVMPSLPADLITLSLVTVVAALTPTLGAFAGAALIGLVVMQFLGSVLQGAMRGPVALPWVIGAILTKLAFAIGIWAAIDQYRRRDTTRSTRFAVIAVALVLCQLFTRTSPTPPWIAENAADAPMAALGANAHFQDSLRTLDVAFDHRGLNPGDRVFLKRPDVRIDGRWIKDESTPYYYVTDPQSPLPAGAHWAEGVTTHNSTFNIMPQIGRRFTSASRIDIRGIVTVERPQIVATIPMVVGAKATSEGVRLRIDSVGPSPAAPNRLVGIDYTTADKLPSVLGMSGREPISFVLVSPNGDAVPLTLIHGGGGSFVMAAPGVDGMRRRTAFKAESRWLNKRHTDSIPVSWRQGSTIAVIRWVETMSRPIWVSTTNISGRR